MQRIWPGVSHDYNMGWECEAWNHSIKSIWGLVCKSWE